MQTNELNEVWYALRTFFAAEQKVKQYLSRNNQPCFIPTLRCLKDGNDDKPVTIEKPVVHNLLFLRKAFADQTLKGILAECPYPIKMYTHPERQEEWARISGQDMLELRIICDNTFNRPNFITQAEAELKAGRMVRVTHGPMKGVTGKLVRKNRKYYVIKSFTALAVEVAVSRWCCEPCDETPEG